MPQFLHNPFIRSGIRLAVGMLVTDAI